MKLISLLRKGLIKLLCGVDRSRFLAEEGLRIQVSRQLSEEKAKAKNHYENYKETVIELRELKNTLLNVESKWRGKIEALEKEIDEKDAKIEHYKETSKNFLIQLGKFNKVLAQVKGNDLDGKTKEIAELLKEEPALMKALKQTSDTLLYYIDLNKELRKEVAEKDKITSYLKESNEELESEKAKIEMMIEPCKKRLEEEIKLNGEYKEQAEKSKATINELKTKLGQEQIKTKSLEKKIKSYYKIEDKTPDLEKKIRDLKYLLDKKDKEALHMANTNILLKNELDEKKGEALKLTNDLKVWEKRFETKTLKVEALEKHISNVKKLHHYSYLESHLSTETSLSWIYVRTLKTGDRIVLQLPVPNSKRIKRREFTISKYTFEGALLLALDARHEWLEKHRTSHYDYDRGLFEWEQL